MRQSQSVIKLETDDTCGVKVSKEDIINCLKNRKSGADITKILDFCKEPRAINELTQLKTKGDLFKSLVDLKKAEGLAFVDGKYVTTPLALEVQIGN